MSTQIKIEKILFRRDLYPRLEVNLQKIQEYSENIGKLPPIDINQDNILIDGYHRLKAHEQAKLGIIEVNIIETKSDNEIQLLSIEKNAKHGLMLSYKDKQSLAIKLFDNTNASRLISILSVSSSRFYDWVKAKKEKLDEERDQRILDLHLQCNTQEQIAEMLDITHKTVSNVLASFGKNSEIGKITKMSDFEPKLYNIWNYAKQNQCINVFGTLPQDIIEQLLYYYTEPFDVVYDPFGGSGITINACKKWYRRYYVSDLSPTPIAKELGTKNWNILEGLPNDLPSPKLVFLDPPYWKQSKNKYSNSEKDLANMPLGSFYHVLGNLFKQLKKKMKHGYIALIIGATQNIHDMDIEDHAVKLYDLLCNQKFKFVQRVIVPYSTEQYNANQVNIAKVNYQMLNLYRDLVIFKN